MSRSTTMSRVVFAVFAALAVLCSIPSLRAQDKEKGEIKRSVLMKHDATVVPGEEELLTQVELMPGAAEAKHTHPGDLSGYVQEGTLTLNVEDKPAETVSAGKAFFVPANSVHWGENKGTTPVKVVAAFVTPKGKPLTVPAK